MRGSVDVRTKLFVTTSTATVSVNVVGLACSVNRNVKREHMALTVRRNVCVRTGLSVQGKRTGTTLPEFSC